MKAEIGIPLTSRIPRGPRSALIPLSLLAIGVPFGLWSLYSLLGGGGTELVEFEAAAGWFVLLAIAYLGIHGLKGFGWFALPVLLTFRALIEMILVPVFQFATGADDIDSMYVRAMFLTLIGFTALWMGSLIFIKESKFPFMPASRVTQGRVASVSLGMLVLGLAGSAILWRFGLYGYAADADLRTSSLPIIQWLTFLASLLPAALIVSSIELLGKRSTEPVTKFVFWASLLFSVGFGALSGMKEGLLTPLLDVVLVYAVSRRLPRIALLLPASLLLVYPFVNAYRNNLDVGYRDTANTVSGEEEVLVKSVDDVLNAPVGTSSVASRGLGDTAGRLSVLSYVRSVVNLPDPSTLNGDEKVWMAPLYPLVPRFLWKSKPVFNKGNRLAILLGIGGKSSAAVTPIGDLYAMYGTSGVVIGMFVWGAVLQLCMNLLRSRNISEKSLFVYIIMLPTLINLEDDAVGWIVAAVQFAIVTVVLAYFVYGSSADPIGAENLQTR